MMSLNMESRFSQENSHGIMGDQLVSVQDLQNMISAGISSSSSTIDDDHDDEEVNSSGSSSPTSPTSSPLQDMSSLLQQLPSKRGLSKHYNGKSQSFTSLSNVSCLGDLAKPENPYNKKLKTCRSYGGLIPRNNTCSRLIGKKTSSTRRINNHSSFVEINNMNNNSNRPPIPPPHRSTSTSTSSITNHHHHHHHHHHTPLFA